MQDWKFEYVVYMILNCELMGLNTVNSVSAFESVGTWYTVKEKLSPNLKLEGHWNNF